MTRLCAAARWYAERGLYVFPCTARSKVPLAGSRGWHDATLDRGRITGWWMQWPEANVAIALAPSGLVVLDVDERHGGRDHLADLKIQHGGLLETWHEHTGADLQGDHHVFRLPADVPATKGLLAEGVEVLAIGYIVVAPSIHPDGGTYRWCIGEEPWTLPLAEAPPWVTAPLLAKPTSTSAPPTGPVADSLLGRAFAAAGWWIREIDATRAAVRCPWAHEHTTGRDGDSSSVIFAPTTGDRVGLFYCSHAHCAHRTVRDVLRILPPPALAQAEAGRGLRRARVA